MSQQTVLSEEKSPAYRHWFSLDALDQQLSNQALHSELQTLLKDAQQTLADKFRAGVDITALVHGRSWLIDQVLTYCWQSLVTEDQSVALVAVGGYGRNELLPGSDIDLMILLEKQESPALAEALQAFLTLLWDIGLEVGHSVRTLEECEVQGRDDITVATNLMEARLLAGPDSLFQSMRERTGPQHIWPGREFFTAKLAEQIRRHERFDDAVYNLEPNVKEGPGGLRDAQMIGWVAKRHFGSDSLEGLVAHGFLTRTEYEQLSRGQQFLWKVRFGLHLLSGRREDRLLFDFQRKLASLLGYEDSDHKQAVEWFMENYYRNIQELSRLNEILLQLFEEEILLADVPARPVVINRRFQSRHGFLEVTGEDVFEHYPFALLELFLIMQQHPELKGIRANTVRLVRANLWRIDTEFRNNLAARSLFMEIFRQPSGLTHELRRMNRYGVLAAYYPAFAKIVGQMQYDLFHVYTVDEHTLFVVRNLRRFMVPEHDNELPLCSRIAKQIAKPELLYLAGFFHDIAKGRGGDHSELGAGEAESFLASHGLSRYDQKLVAWLVRHHLVMSQTAQRRDINDPDVINEFASLVGDRQRLDYLYLLTVADIRGTSPKLWNSWKDALLKELYTSTKRALRRGLENPLDRDELVTGIRISALNSLVEAGYRDTEIESLWQRLPDDYYLRHSPEEIVWQSQLILASPDSNEPRIDLKPTSERGGSALFIYTPVIDGLFNRTTTTLEKLGLTITDARIFTSSDNYAVNTYHILTTDDQPVSEPAQIDTIIDRLKKALRADDWRSEKVTRTHGRREKHFAVKTRITFSLDSTGQRTILELITTDRPGLLSRVARAFYACDALLQNAKIATFGTQAEDVFYLVSKNGGLLDEQQLDCLREQLIETLEPEQV